ncbi:replication initiator protein A [Ralstonia insidiosa]|uniref:replication initiator protein A n=1 Tax=Ralstonia insidiosa TaxID=190721 RepID=UPI0023819E42|nr:replication initiator protein A [Ralstonia insidiosa]MDE4928792.1 replication initiator protein A [Ralstonia insidiosa]
MSKSSTPRSLAPVSQAQNTPELADLFGELQVISSEQAASDETDAPAQGDLFEVVVLVHDWPVKDDVSSMEYPIFSLSKNKDTRIRTYSRGGKTLKVIPSALGAATVFDKDILLYCLSQIVKAHEAGMTVGRRLKIAVHPFLIGTRRSTGGAAYERVLDMCRRLKGTTIETNVKTNEREQVEGFGLIEDYKVTQYTKNGKGALELELTIADWLYRAAIASDILTLHPNYFSLGQALERRLYELGRKHCGQQPWFVIGLPLLQEKAGSTQSASHFRTELKDIIKNDRLPDYRLALDESSKPNQLVYMTRDNKRLVTEANRAGKLTWVSGLLQQSMEMAKAKGKPKAVA